MDRLLPCGKRGVRDDKSSDRNGADSTTARRDKFIDSEDDEVDNAAAAVSEKLSLRQRLLACTGGGGGGHPSNVNNNNREDDQGHNDDNNHKNSDNDTTDELSGESSTTLFTRRLASLVLTEHYTILRKIGTGTFGSVLLCLSHRDQSKVALKKLPKATTKLEDFQREFLFSFRLSSHQAIVKTFDIAFKTRTSFVFAQEYAPKGDLLRSVTPRRGLTEAQAKTVARQIGAALEFIHAQSLVHRDVKPVSIRTLIILVTSLDIVIGFRIGDDNDDDEK